MTGAYVALVPSYTVAAWEERRKAGLGLALVLVGALIVNHGTPGDLAGAVLAVSAAWAAGRAIRARRLLNAELGRTSARLAFERRIARGLPSPASARGSRVSCTRPSRTAWRRW